jgi:hypothetical protein
MLEKNVIPDPADEAPLTAAEDHGRNVLAQDVQDQMRALSSDFTSRDLAAALLG